MAALRQAGFRARRRDSGVDHHCVHMCIQIRRVLLDHASGGADDPLLHLRHFRQDDLIAFEPFRPVGLERLAVPVAVEQIAERFAAQLFRGAVLHVLHNAGGNHGHVGADPHCGREHRVAGALLRVAAVVIRVQRRNAGVAAGDAADVDRSAGGHQLHIRIVVHSNACLHTGKAADRHSVYARRCRDRARSVVVEQAREAVKRHDAACIDRAVRRDSGDIDDGAAVGNNALVHIARDAAKLAPGIRLADQGAGHGTMIDQRAHAAVGICDTRDDARIDTGIVAARNMDIRILHAEILHHSTVQVRKQAGGNITGWHILRADRHIADDMVLSIEHTGENMRAGAADRRPRLTGQRDVRREHHILTGVILNRIDRCRKRAQLLGGRDLVGILRRSGATCEDGRIHRIIAGRIAQQRLIEHHLDRIHERGLRNGGVLRSRRRLLLLQRLVDQRLCQRVKARRLGVRDDLERNDPAAFDDRLHQNIRAIGAGSASIVGAVNINHRLGRDLDRNIRHLGRLVAERDNAVPNDPLPERYAVRQFICNINREIRKVCIEQIGHGLRSKLCRSFGLVADNDRAIKAVAVLADAAAHKIADGLNRINAHAVDLLQRFRIIIIVAAQADTG